MSMWKDMFGANPNPQQQMQRMMFTQQLGNLGAGLMQASGPVPYGQNRAGMFGRAMQSAMPMQMAMMQQQQQMAQAQQKQQMQQQIAAAMGGGSVNQMAGQLTPAGQVSVSRPQDMQKAMQLAIGSGDYDAARFIQAQMKQQQGAKPPTGMRKSASGQWEYDPNYLSGQIQLKKAGKTDLNIYNSPEAKLLADYDAALKTGDTKKAETLGRLIQKKAQPSGEAARAQEMAQTGSVGMQTIIDEMMPGGEVNRDAVKSSWANLPWTEGRTTNSRMAEAVGLMLRMETGAAQTAEEVENTLKRYAPSPLDNDATIKDKLTRLKRRFDATLKIHTGKEPGGQTPADPLGLR